MSKSFQNLNWPLMKNNVTRADLDAVIAYLRRRDPILKESKNVRAFETEWSSWLGVDGGASPDGRPGLSTSERRSPRKSDAL